MAAEQMMHNLVNPPAAASRAAATYVLDLTSWCVKSGSVQLPQTLLGRFCVGEVRAQSDGGELDLEFRAPRVLAGLSVFFEQHGLRANDRIEFSFEGDTLRITCQRREKQHRETVARPSGQRTAPTAEGRPPVDQRGATDGSSGPRRRASDWTDAVDREVAQLAVRRRERAEEAASRGIVVDRFGGPVEDLVTGHDPQRERQAGSTPALAPAPAARMVTTVRIEGGVPAQPSPGMARPKDSSSAHQVWARKANAHWHSLDALQPDVHGGNGQDPEFPDTVVRAYRRSANGSLSHEPLNSLPAAPSQSSREEPTSNKQAAGRQAGNPATEATTLRWAAEVPDAGVRDRPRKPTRGASPLETSDDSGGQQYREATPLEVRASSPFAAAGVAGGGQRDQGRGRNVAREPDAVRTGAFAELTGENDERYLDGDQPEAAESVDKGPHRGMMSRIGLRLGIGRERSAAARGGNPHQETSHQVSYGAPAPYHPSTNTAASPHQANPTASRAHGSAGSDGLFQGLDAGGNGPYRGAAPQVEGLNGHMSQAAAAGHMQVAPAARPESSPERWARPVSIATTLQDALLDPDDAAIAGEAQEVARAAETPRAPAPTASVSDDAAFLQSYLVRPGTPAIVRSIDLAEKLGMSPERALRAMNRLSEERDRFSKIKDGAYMVRQKPG